jgi:hypothetical protein
MQNLNSITVYTKSGNLIFLIRKNNVSLETVTLVLTGSDPSVENRLDLVFWSRV